MALDLDRLETLFNKAADLPPSERPACLQGADEDPAIVNQVLAMLACDDASLTLPEPTIDRDDATGVFEDAPGAVIGRYKLLQTIGEGGFGVVYMAEQQQPVVRKVALKVIKLGMDTREVVARFEAERQALAMMDHPSIAKVLDGGMTEAGRPFFVMELVRGVAVTRFCDENDLSTRDRIDLFIDICSAVQHAHQKGIIHRDLKPTNVLVTLHDGRPVPKVIDFGVAKAMHTRLTEKTLFTRYEQFIGTPAYMSPEQAQMSPLDIDTRTDIYSLGVLLYELLTGTTPYDTQSFERAGLAEVQRIIREEQPPRPSVRISTRGDAGAARCRQEDVPGLSRLLRGDLDWIVMRALEKDRSRRYATVGELAEDIRRHLRHEPVQAGPPSTSYRLRKFIQRNRAAVVPLVILALAGIVTLIGVGYAKIEADRHAVAAERQTLHTLAALDFLDDTLSLANPEVALEPEMTVGSLLAEASVRIPDAFADQPWTEARLRTTIGRAYAALSENELAEPQLRRAAEIVETQLAETDGVFDWPGFDAGEAYELLWALTNVCFNLERGDAFAISIRAREVGLRHVAVPHPELADTLVKLVQRVAANAWSLEPDAMDDVPAMFAEAAAAAERTLPAGDPLWPIVADTFLAAGYTIWYTPHEPLAEHFWRETLAIQRRELPPHHPDIATTVALLVGILNGSDRADEAERLIRDSIASLTRVHPGNDFRLAVAESLLGETMVRQGKYAEAEPRLLAAHATILETVKDATNFNATESLMRMIGLYDAWDRPAAAAPYRATLAVACRDGRHVMPWRITRECFGRELAPLVAELDAANTACGGISYLVVLGTHHAPGLADRLPGIFEVRRTMLADGDPRSIALGRVALGWANALEPSEIATRATLAEEAGLVLAEAGAELAVERGEALAILADIALRRGDTDRAVTLGRQASETVRSAAREGMWYSVAGEIRIGRTLLELDLYPEAETLLRRGYDDFLSQHGSTFVDSQLTRALLYDLYTEWGRPAEARLHAPRDGDEHKTLTENSR